MQHTVKIVFSFILILCGNFVFSQSFDYLPVSNTHHIIKHRYYTLSYSGEYKQSEWVAYMICKSRLSGNIKRADNFVQDPMIFKQYAKSEDYKKSGFDRGHLVPSADMKFDEIAMKECFYMSNISPQTPSFNRGIWKKLEEMVRNWAYDNDTLYIISGGILKNIEKYIGNNQIAVPEYFYKIILKYNSKISKAIAFIIPNEKIYNDIYNYVVSIDKVEEVTGIDFFPKLPDDIEVKLEKEIDTDFWR